MAYGSSFLLENLYYYEAKLIRCVDADSAWFKIDRGFRDFSHKNIRLARIDAFELRGAEKLKGLAAKEFAQRQYDKAEKILIKSVELDSFGRSIAETYLLIDGEWCNLSDDLVMVGHAIYKSY